MLESDRPEFDRQVAILFAALDKPATAERCEAFFKSCSKMSLIDFARVVDALLAKMNHGAPPRYFTPSDVWEAWRRLKAWGGTQAAPPVDEAPSDPWWIQSNFHFLAFMFKRIAHRQQFDASAEAIAPYLEFKNAWARDMREADTGSGVATAYQESEWNDCMHRAEVEVMRRRQLKQPIEASADVHTAS